MTWHVFILLYTLLVNMQSVILLYSVQFPVFTVWAHLKERDAERDICISAIILASPLAPVHILPYLISWSPKMTIIANRIFPLQKSTVALPWNWDRIRCQGERGNENVAEIRAWLSIHWQMLVESVWVLSNCWKKHIQYKRKWCSPCRITSNI